MKQHMFRVEAEMLKQFGFVTHVEHPHKFVLSLLQSILEQSGPILQVAWNLTNDRYSSLFPLQSPVFELQSVINRCIRCAVRLVFYILC